MGIGYIDTSDNIDHNQIQIVRVWSLVDKIEDIKQMMAHDIPELNDKLKDYQDGKLNRSYFINYLTKYLDNLEGN